MVWQVNKGPGGGGGSGDVIGPAGATNGNLAVFDGATGKLIKDGGPIPAGGSPTGANTEIQFNDGGLFGADAQFTWNKTTNVLTVSGSLAMPGATSGVVTVAPAAIAGTWSFTLPTTGGAAGQFLQTNGAGVATWAAQTSDIPLAYLDIDGTLAANSDTKVASQKATKTYVDGLIAAANAMVYKGVIDCSTNPNYPAADAGWVYIVSVDGKIGGALGPDVHVGDLILCNTDGSPAGNHATVGANWNIIERQQGVVIGPASATNNNVALFDGTTGKLIKDGGPLPAATTPGGATTNVQYNNGGAFAGEAAFAWDNSSKALTLGVAGASQGNLNLAGVTSGIVTLRGAAAAGTWNLTLPTTGGTNGYFLQTDGTGATTWAAGGSGANVSLSNLAGVAINAALIPATAGALDLGTSAKPWADLWLAGSSGTPATNQFRLTGASTSGVRTLTMQDASGTIAYLSDIPAAVTPGGATTNVQYNNGGAFAGDSGMVWDSSTKALTIGALGATGSLNILGLTSGSVGIKTAAVAGAWNLTLPTTGGTNGYFLQTNGAGVATWAAATGTPAGSSTQIQFNNAGAFGASAGLTYASGSDTLSIGTTGSLGGKLGLKGSTSGTVTLQTAAAAGTWALTLPTTAGTALQFLQTDGAGNTTWATPAGGSVSTGVANKFPYYNTTTSLIDTSAGSATIGMFWDNTTRVIRMGETNTNGGNGRNSLVIGDLNAYNADLRGSLLLGSQNTMSFGAGSPNGYGAIQGGSTNTAANIGGSVVMGSNNNITYSSGGFYAGNLNKAYLGSQALVVGAQNEVRSGNSIVGGVANIVHANNDATSGSTVNGAYVKLYGTYSHVLAGTGFGGTFTRVPASYTFVTGGDSATALHGSNSPYGQVMGRACNAGYRSVQWTRANASTATITVNMTSEITPQYNSLPPEFVTGATARFYDMTGGDDVFSGSKVSVDSAITIVSFSAPTLTFTIDAGAAALGTRLAGRVIIRDGAEHAHASGWGAVAYQQGMQSRANGYTDYPGDQQASQIILRKVTANATPALLLANVAANKGLYIQPHTTWGFTITVVGKKTGAATAGYFKYEGLITRNGLAAPVISGTPAFTVQKDNPAWDCTIAAGGTDTLDITVTGEAASVKWVARVELTEVTYA